MAHPGPCPFYMPIHFPALTCLDVDERVAAVQVAGQAGRQVPVHGLCAVAGGANGPLHAPLLARLSRGNTDRQLERTSYTALLVWERLEHFFFSALGLLGTWAYGAPIISPI